MKWHEIETKWREMAHRTQAHWDAKTDFPKIDAPPASPRLPPEIIAGGQESTVAQTPVGSDDPARATLPE